MENTQAQMDQETQVSPVEFLKQQAIEKKNANNQVKKTGLHERSSSSDTQETGEGQDEEKESYSPPQKTESKKIKFNKGDRDFEVDEDAILEFIADKKPVKMNLKELRDAAAGGVAVRNRMRELADEKKAIQSVFNNFSKAAKEDPVSALQLILSKVNEVDSEMTYEKFMTRLADQAKEIADMEPDEQKLWERQRELTAKEKSLRSKELITMREDLEERLEMDADMFDHLANFVVDDPDLSKKIKTEEDIIKEVGELYREITLHKVSLGMLQGIDPTISPRSPIVNDLSKVIRLNPDFDEKDWLDVIRGTERYSKRDSAKRYLSNKQRTSASDDEYIAQGMSSFEVLKRKAEAKKRLKQKVS